MSDIKHLVTIDAPIPVVYMALTEQDGLAGWWTTDTIANPIVGSIAGFRFGDRYHNTMRIEALEADSRVEWICLDGDPEWVDTSFVFELESRDGSTVLRFTHGNWREMNDFFATCSYHWGFYMRSLKAYCDNRQGPTVQPETEMAWMIRRAWFVLLAIAVLLGVVAVLALTHLRMRAASTRLPERGSVTENVVGCPARVEVVLDDRGIPHVESASESAMWFSLGYLHARERFFQMELGRRAGAGRLAEIFGESALDNDRKMRTLRLAASARRQSALLSPEERRVLENYSAGVNAAINRFGKWIAPETWLLGVEPEPWQIEDSLTIGLLLQLDLSWAMGEELKRAVELVRLGREKAVDLWGWTPTQAHAWIPPGEGVRQPRRDYEPITPPMGGIGSNSWAVSPQRSAVGRPLLANDPHLGVQMPGSFFAVHLRGPRTHVAGATIAGIPGVIIGHTEDVAWGLTLAMVDDQDLFKVTLDDAGTRELIDGRWQSLRTVTEDISVRWQDAPMLLKVRFSRHGPLVREQRGETLALSWTGFQGPEHGVSDSGDEPCAFGGGSRGRLGRGPRTRDESGGSGFRRTHSPPGRWLGARSWFRRRSLAVARLGFAMGVERFSKGRYRAPDGSTERIRGRGQSRHLR